VFVDLESQPVQRQDTIRIVVLPAQFRIPPASRFPHGLQHGPLPRVRQQPLEQILPAVLADQIRPPPAEPRLFPALLASRHCIELSCLAQTAASTVAIRQVPPHRRPLTVVPAQAAYVRPHRVHGRKSRL